MIDRPEDVVFHRRCTRSDFNSLTELCCGLGIGTYGFDMCGMKTVCAADWSEPLLQAYSELHPGTPTVLGDIGQKSTICQVYANHRVFRASSIPQVVPSVGFRIKGLELFTAHSVPDT